MSTGHYHNPPKPASARVRCPVCREEVYSRAGIHPQCAVKQWEPSLPKAKPPVSPERNDQPVSAAEPAVARVVVAPLDPVNRTSPE